MKPRGVIAVAVVLYAVLGIPATLWIAGGAFYGYHKAWPESLEITTWLDYWQAYGNDPVQRKPLQVSLVVAIAAVYVVPGLIFAQILSGPGRPLHGAARFANTTEIRKAGLFAETGIIVGKYAGRFLVFGGQQFVLVAAPTRSGKGVAVVIPNLLNYAGSVVVLDIKLENFNLTSAYRAAHGQKVFLFNPFAETYHTHRWNPLDAIRRDPNYRVGDILTVGQTLYPSGGDKDAFWNDQARNLFLGIVLFLLETPDLPVTLGEVLRQSSGQGKPVRIYLEDLIDDRNRSESPLSAECQEALSRFCATSENTLTSILATFNAPLTMFANPLVDAATSQCDFELARVRQEKQSIYIGIQPDKLADAALLINLLFSQLINLNVRTQPKDDPTIRHDCLVILDEFAALGRINILAKANAFISGYGLRLLTVVQSVAQLESVYGERDARTLMTNHALQILFAPRETRDANAYSEMLGYTTEKVKSRSVSHNRGGGPGHGSKSESVSDQRRALMLPQELRELPRDEEIIVIEGAKPVQAKKALYYAEADLVGRLKSVSPGLAALKGALPSQAQIEAASRGDLRAPLPKLDVDLFVAKNEQRTRPLQPGEAVDVKRLAIDVSQIPPVDNQQSPSPQVMESIVSAFFGQTQGRPVEATEPNKLATAAQETTRRPRRRGCQLDLEIPNVKETS
ncbi:type IV secretory system conjugative DNA transfer family protein [Asticcacaulis sp. W401b]|uniref:type IV secretory system conjugative DNA transfer family protein n=1 Tax=Asticcacaulis sp. W401b TaxID=3388666 RepID=UPI003970A140